MRIFRPTLEILRWPLFWMMAGAFGISALLPGWNGRYGASSVWWVHSLVWLGGIVIILAIAKASLNYVNDRSFWTGKNKYDREAFSRLQRDVDASKLEIAFWRWASRSQINVEMLSQEHRDMLHQEILSTISKALPKDFFRDERNQIDQIVAKSRHSLEEINQTKDTLGIIINDAAKKAITGDALKDFYEKADEHIARKLQITLATAQDGMNAILAQVQEMITEKISSAIRESSIDRRLERPISDGFEEITQNLYRFLMQNIRRANVYLYIGISIGLLGVTAFSVYFFSAIAHPEIWALLARAGLLLAFEAFAMFFLRLYKATLADISFYQNEISTMLSKRAGMNFAAHIAAQHDYKPLLEAVSSLINLDRNSIIEKDHTTRNLEEKKLYSQEELELIKAAAEVIKAARGK